MKKNLAVSICMLALAALTLCGVTFAYFSSNGGSEAGYVTIGEFVFERTDEVTGKSALTQQGTYRFRAPTVLNVPEVVSTDPAFSTDGDDALFDEYCVPVLTTVTNRSRTDMTLAVEVTARANNEDGTVNYAANGAVQSFSFDAAETKKLVAGGENEGKYGGAIRAVCGPAAADTAGLSVFESTRAKLAAGQRLMAESLAGDVLHAYTLDADKTPVYAKAQILTLIWLDWRGYEGSVGDRKPGSIIVEVKITASNHN